MQSDNVLLITLALLLVLAPLVRSLLVRNGIPALVGYIALGFLVSILDHQWLFVNTVFENTFSVLAQLGIVALLFRVGLKSHTRALLAKLPDASLIWIGDVLTNLAIGYLVSFYVLHLSLETSLIIATAFSATSVAVSVAVWDELRLMNTSRAQLLVDVAELDDLSGVLLLAILLAVIPVLLGEDGNLLSLIGTTTFTVLLKLALFVTGCYLFAHFLEAGITRFSREQEGSATAVTITILGIGILIAAVSGYLGFSLAIGALFAGLAFSRDPQAVHADTRFGYFYEFFTPFFFIQIGMQIDPGTFFTSITLALLLLVAAIVGKVVGVGGAALVKLPKTDAMLLGVSMVPRAEIALVVIYQCQQVGGNLVPDKIYTAMVWVSVMTSIVAPLVVRSLLTRQTGKKKRNRTT